jgi:hypothetical protein
MHRTAWLRIVAATALLAAAPFVPLPPASAAAVISATSGFTGTTASIGQTLTTSVTVTNLSTAPDGAMALDTIFFVPSCGSTGPITSDCPVDSQDPNVFEVHPVGTGASGTGCAGTTFTVQISNASGGRYELAPEEPIVLAPPAAGDLDTCQIELIVTIAASPTVDSRPGTPGLQTDAFGLATGTVDSGVQATATGGSFLTIEGAAPSLVTQVAEPEVVVGDPVADTATLSGGAEPSGSITFDLFGPDDEDCSGPPLASSTHPVDGAGAYTSSATSPSAAGAYRFVARYSGDADNQSVSGTCGDPNESVAVSASEPPGIRILKVATPLSRPEPGGTFSFELTITNTSAVPLTISGLTDDVYGDVATLGTCTDAVGTALGPGDAYECAFAGELAGNAGTTQTDVVTVTAVDGTGTAVTDQDDAVVSLTDVPPSVTVAKTALPEVRAAPGGLFTFGLTVTNTSGEPVTITALSDDVYGDLGQRTGSSCGAAVGTVLDPGEALACTFEGELTGAVGAAQTDIVTVTVTDDDGSTGTAQDDATIRLVAPGEVPTTTTTVAPTTTTRPVTSTTRPARLASTGASTRSSALLAGALVGIGLLLTGLGATASGRRRPAIPVHPDRP